VKSKKKKKFFFFNTFHSLLNVFFFFFLSSRRMSKSFLHARFQVATIMQLHTNTSTTTTSSSTGAPHKNEEAVHRARQQAIDQSINQSE